MTTGRFGAATAQVRLDDGLFAWDVPDGWQQGPGAWGGLVAGGVAQAVASHQPDPGRSLRTLSVHLASPLPVGRATVRVAALRVGSALSTWSVTVEAAPGRASAYGVAITGAPRATDLADAAGTWGTAEPPALPPWREVEPVPALGPGWPTFMQHVEFRGVEGLPLAGGPARCRGYVRFSDQQSWDAPQLLSVVDAWFPTAFTVLDALRPLATVAYTAHLLVDPATVPPGEPLAFESNMSGAYEGFTSELRRLWTLDGRLAVENHQCLVVVR